MKARRLRIAPELWVEFLKQDTPVTLRVTRNALPADARCVGMVVDPLLIGMRGYVNLLIESASFRDDDPDDLEPSQIAMVPPQ